MRQLISFMHISLDGFVAGPNGEMDWITFDEELFDYIGKRIGETDTALYGRVTFEMMQNYWPTAADKPNASKHDREHAAWYKKSKKIVLSETMKDAGLANTQIISGNLADSINKIKQHAGSEILLFGSPTANSQDTAACPQTDLPTVISGWRNKEPKQKVEGASSLILLPIIGSNPATGFMIGVGGQYAFKMPESTRYSLLSGSMQFTTKKQFIVMLKNTIYTPNDKIFLTGDWRFLIYSQSTYGLGTNAPEGGILEYQFALDGTETSDDSLAQPMSFNFARLYQSIGFKISEGIYLGLGYRYDGYFKIVDEKLNLQPGDTTLTSHYAYNTNFGFNTASYSNSAITANFVLDTRDNMINAYKGYYVNAGWRGSFLSSGDEKYSNIFDVEYRSFHGLSATNKAHVLAFWFLGTFTEPGGLPYMVLPATAYDQRGRSARGYTQGRFRGENLVYGEAEYRFPLTGCGGLLSGVLFVNATSASNQALELDLLQSIKPGYGFGFRLMADKSSRTNLAIDFGFGAQSFGFYLAASETF